MKFLSEFKKFAFKGNVLDMAVGVIIGASFGKIVTSLVNDIIMPAISILISTDNLSDLAFRVQRIGTSGEENLVSISYGSFLVSVIDFLIIALCVFIMVKAVNRMRANAVKTAAPPPPPKPTEQEKLLAEIRDLIREKKESGQPEEPRQ